MSIYICPRLPTISMIDTIRLLFSCSFTGSTRFTVNPTYIVHRNNLLIFSWKDIFNAFHKETNSKARKSRELDMLSDYGNMDVMLGEGNSNSIERELDSLINAPEGPQDFRSFPNRENSSQENEIRDIDSRNEPVEESRLLESIIILCGEMNARMSREMETMMDLMHSQISSAISSAISERIIPEIQNMVENLPLGQYGVEPCTSTNEDGIGNVWKNANTKFTKKDSRSACNLRDHTDSVPYNI